MSYQESEDEQALKLHTRYGVGIYSEYVEMEIEDVHKLAFAAAQQACATSNEPSMPNTFK